MSERGWDWFEPAPDTPTPATDIETTFARCFSGPDGERSLAHLRDLTVGRVLGPEASDAALRHLEAQRGLVAYIGALIRRGRGIA